MNDYTLYIHTTPNNKVYIGITHLKPKHRYGKNGNGYSSCTLFWRAIQKYGWDNIQHIALADNLSKEWACKLEQDLIWKYKSNDPKYGYNGSAGGESGSFGHIMSEESKQKISNSLLGHKHSEETKQKIGRANSLVLKGKKVPQSVRNKISKNNARYWAGKRLPENTLQKAAEVNRGNKYRLGHKHSEETKQKMRMAKLGKKRGPWSDEERKVHMEAIERRKREQSTASNI